MYDESRPARRRSSLCAEPWSAYECVLTAFVIFQCNRTKSNEPRPNLVKPSGDQVSTLYLMCCTSLLDNVG